MGGINRAETCSVLFSMGHTVASGLVATAIAGKPALFVSSQGHG